MANVHTKLNDLGRVLERLAHAQDQREMIQKDSATVEREAQKLEPQSAAETRQMPADELKQRQQQLNERKRAVEAGHAPPDQQLDELDHAFAETRARQAHLAQIAACVERVETCAPAWNDTRARAEWLARIQVTQEETAHLQSAEPTLLNAFQALQSLQAQTEPFAAQRNAIIETVKGFEQELAARKSAKLDKWANLVFENRKLLTQYVTAGLGKLDEKIKSARKEEEKLAKQVAARDGELQPVRQRVARAEKLEREHAARFQEEEDSEVAQWCNEMIAQDIPTEMMQNVDGTDTGSLSEFLARLEAKRAALAWFEETTQP